MWMKREATTGRGWSISKKAFMDHAPKNQEAEAERNYGLAVKEFKAAISRDFSFCRGASEPGANCITFREISDGAAEEYKRVTELAPGDLDAYVNLALALIELSNPRGRNPSP